MFWHPNIKNHATPHWELLNDSLHTPASILTHWSGYIHSSTHPITCCPPIIWVSMPHPLVVIKPPLNPATPCGLLHHLPMCHCALSIINQSSVISQDDVFIPLSSVIHATFICVIHWPLGLLLFF